MIDLQHLTPDIRSVAILAWRRGLNVISRLAGPCYPVMTVGAGTNNRVMAHPCKWLPELIRVAFLTQQGRLNMIFRQLVCSHQAALIVTSRARYRSSLK